MRGTNHLIQKMLYFILQQHNMEWFVIYVMRVLIWHLMCESNLSSFIKCVIFHANLLAIRVPCLLATWLPSLHCEKDDEKYTQPQHVLGEFLFFPFLFIINGGLKWGISNMRWKIKDITKMWENEEMKTGQKQQQKKMLEQMLLEIKLLRFPLV